MSAFRYRTKLMVGPWRSTRRDALADAVRCGLARWAGEPWDQVAWRFPGEIEEREEDTSS